MSTAFRTLNSEGILSAHINGLSHAINNIERTLGMRTATVTGHTLRAITDMNDITLRNRIYEGTIRNWTTFTVRRNGTAVSTDEFASHAGFGAIVFHVAQNPAAIITVDATHVTHGSTVLDELQQSGDDTHSTTVLQPRNAWITGLVFMPSATPITGIAQAPQTIDAMPIYLKETSRIDRLRCTTSPGTHPTTTMVMGIFNDNNTFPGTRLAQTASFNATSAGVNDHPLQGGAVTLTAGLYWLTRYQSGGLSLNGFEAAPLMQIFDPTNTAHINGTAPANFCQAVRTTAMGVLTALPATFPALGATTAQYLKRAHIATVWARKV